MTKDLKNDFIRRIGTVNPDDKAKFGKMNVSQMICHCADQFRMMFGEVKGLRRQNIDPEELKRKTINREPLPTVDGLDQVAGGGTKPTDFDNDKETLINYLNTFNKTDESHMFSFHPFLGDIDRNYWERLVIHHLNHHLEQFGR